MAIIRRRNADAEDNARYLRYLPIGIALPGILLALFLVRDQIVNANNNPSFDGIKNGLKKSVVLRNQTKVYVYSEVSEPPKDGFHIATSTGKNEIYQGRLKSDNAKPKEKMVVADGNGNIEKPQQKMITAPSKSTSQGVLQSVAETKPSSWTCQIVYIVGVEGSGHHGVADQVMLTLAKNQVDAGGQKYNVLFRDPQFRMILAASHATPKQRTIFGARAGTKITPEEIKRGMNEVCGPKYGGAKKTVIIEDVSFPYGFETRKMFEGRPAIDIAAILDISPTPVDIKKFADIFEPHADVKFIVLHRPFFNTAVSHSEFKLDGGIVEHGKILLGHLMYFGKIFRENREANMLGKASWKLLCVNHLRNDANKETDDQGLTTRERLVAALATFLEWDQSICKNCFTKWFDSKKDPAEAAGKANFTLLEKQRDTLRDFWPPSGDGGDDCPL